MIINGNAIAQEIYREVANEVSHLSHIPHLTVFTCAPNLATKKYLALKKKKATEVGIGISIIEFPDSLTTPEMMQSVRHACMQTDGIIVQLPLPTHIDTDKVLSAIPKKYDVDGMHYDGTESTFMSPVVGAVAEIAQRYDVLFRKKNVVVVGNGRLVGAPCALWAQKQGAYVQVLDKESKNSKKIIASADILILGAGSPALVTPDMIKDGVSIFDAGASEDGGEIIGDAHPDCATKASLFTPVPKGIGPITVAILLRNVVSTITT